MLKNIIKNLSLLVFGIVVALLISETFLRIYNPLELRVKGDKIVLPANSKYIIHTKHASKLDRIITHTKNSLGFRGEEPPVDFKEYITIFAVGGSTTESLLISDNNDWVSLLQTMLRNNYDKIWINNAGLDGQSTYGHAILLQDHIIKFNPDYILFLIGINDIGLDNARFHDKKMLKTINLDTLTSFVLSIANNSEVLTLLVNLYRHHKAKDRGLTHNTQINLFELSKDPLVLSSEKIKSILKRHKISYLNRYESRIKKLITISRKNGIEPIFITQPVLYGNTVDRITKVDLASIKINEGTNGLLGWKLMELYNDVLRKTAKNERVLLVDLAKTVPKDSSYYYDIIHYSNEGSRKVAALIYDKLCLYFAESHRAQLSAECN